MVACRKGGLSIMGVYGGFVDKMPFGAANKGLTFRMGQMGQKYMNMLLELVLNGKLDPSFVYTHLALSKHPGLRDFSAKKRQLHQVVLKPRRTRR